MYATLYRLFYAWVVDFYWYWKGYFLVFNHYSWTLVKSRRCRKSLLFSHLFKTFQEFQLRTFFCQLSVVYYMGRKIRYREGVKNRPQNGRGGRRQERRPHSTPPQGTCAKKEANNWLFPPQYNTIRAARANTSTITPLGGIGGWAGYRSGWALGRQRAALRWGGGTRGSIVYRTITSWTKKGTCPPPSRCRPLEKTTPWAVSRAPLPTLLVKAYGKDSRWL